MTYSSVKRKQIETFLEGDSSWCFKDKELLWAGHSKMNKIGLSN